MTNKTKRVLYHIFLTAGIASVAIVIGVLFGIIGVMR
jgi:hypothetical protein